MIVTARWQRRTSFWRESFVENYINPKEEYHEKHSIHVVQLVCRQPASPRRQRPLKKLRFESLETSRGLFTSSFSLHAVGLASDTSAAFFHIDDSVKTAFFEKTPQGQVNMIATAGNVTNFSAGLDHFGNPEVYAHVDGVMQEYTQNTGWTSSTSRWRSRASRPSIAVACMAST